MSRRVRCQYGNCVLNYVSSDRRRKKAAVAWYGSDRMPSELTPKNPLDIAADVKCPVLALYGGADQSIPQEAIEKRRAACKPADKTCEFAVYPDAPHGFNADYARAIAPTPPKTAGQSGR